MAHLTKEKLAKEFPAYLFKVSERKEYIDDLLSGNLYMNVSGDSRKLEDTYRGDKFDGRRPIDVSECEIKLRSEDGEEIILNRPDSGMVSNFHTGFAGDDRIPMFCSGMLTADIMEITGDEIFRIKKEYIEELKKFGNYVAVISVEEMYEKLRVYNQANPTSAFLYGRVKYTDIMHEYSLTDCTKEDELGVYSSFFKKDLSYRFQNEWRVLMVGSEPPVPENEDHVVLNVGKFEYGVSMHLNLFEEGEFQIKEGA